MKWAILICVVFMARVAGAQIIFLPVQYQYGDPNKYYYGGSDPAVFRLAEGEHTASWGRINGFSFYSGAISHFREVASEPLQAFSDQLPYENAAIYGYTASDARNDAEANIPRYFCKRDLIAAGIRQPDGSLVVPAQAQPIRVADGASHAAQQPLPILIVPKGEFLPAPRSNNVVIVKN